MRRALHGPGPSELPGILRGGAWDFPRVRRAPGVAGSFPAPAALAALASLGWGGVLRPPGDFPAGARRPSARAGRHAPPRLARRVPGASGCQLRGCMPGHAERVCSAAPRRRVLDAGKANVKVFW